jgi:multiple sugar transport system substrate-binding protein
MKKAPIILLLAMALPLLFLTACGKGKETTIRILTHWDATNSTAFQAYIEEYEAQNKNVKIELQTVPFGELMKKISTSGLSSDGPDIYHIYSAWLPELAGSKTIASAPSDFNKDIQQAYAANIVDSVTVGGAIYGYPTELTTYALNYNKRLFTKVGIAGPPKDWQELVADAKKLTVKSGGKVTQQGFGVITGWDSGVVHPWISLLQSNGGRFLADGNKKAAFNDASGKETIALYKALLDSGAINPEMSPSNASTTGGYQNNFELGHTAMIIMANWWKSGLQSTMKDAYADIGTAPIPIGPHGDKSSAIFYSWLYSVNSKSKQQAEAWKFLKWLNSPKAAGESSRQGTWLMSQGIIPSRTSDQKANASVLGDPFMRTYVDLLADAKPFPIVRGGAEITATLQKQVEAVLFGQAKPDDALDSAEKQINDILSK